MRRLILLAAAIALIHANDAPAQYLGPYTNQRFGPQVSPYYTPPVSPYLNLVRSNNPALQYYLGTLPEFDRQRFQSATQQGFMGLESYLGQPQPPLDFGGVPTLPQTGHLSAFQAYGGYYNYGQQQRPYYPFNPNQARMLPRQ
jgi:hypothetical protein